jgi:hypothetical protein
MKVDVSDLLKGAGLEKEGFYPGKKLVKKYLQHGEHKSHCMVFEWTDRIRVELKAGTTGSNLDPKVLKQYPVSFQAPTYLEILPKEDDDEDEDTSRGKSGGGGKKPAMKKASDLSTMNAFQKMADGAVSLTGEIKKFVVMGKEIAKEAYAQAYENLKEQLQQSKIMALDLMKGVSDIIQKVMPGGGLERRGDEKIPYKYDPEKTAAMFGGLTPS